jgi:hypothetical protein
MPLSTTQYYVDPALTQISLAYRNDPDQFISEVVAPVIEVPKITGWIWKYGTENLKKPTDTTRTGFSKTKITNFSRTKMAYGPLLEHDLKIQLSKDELEMTDSPLDAQRDAVLHLNEQMAIEKEINLANTLSNTSLLTNNVNLGTDNTKQWSTYASSHPFLDIVAGVQKMRKTGLKSPNTIIMSSDVWAQLQNHPDLLDRVKFSTLGVLTEELFITLMKPQGISRLVIANAVYDNAAEGLTASNTFIWGKHCWLAYITGTPALNSLNGAYTLTKQNGRYVDTWTDQDEKALNIRNNDYYQQYVVGPEAFYLIQNAVV